MYRYAANNPVKYTDPDGEWIQFVVGAALGGISSAIISSVDQYKEKGRIDFSTTALAFCTGAISGTLAASGVGLLGQVIGNGILAGVNYAADNLINCTDMSINEFTESVAVGLLGGLLGGAGATTSSVKSQMTIMGKRMTSAFKHGAFDFIKSEFFKSLKYYWLNGGKKATIETIKSVLKASLSPILETIQDEMPPGLKQDILDFIDGLSKESLEE